MKLYINSVFDKDTNKIEDAKQKAFEAANRLEAQHNNLGVRKIYYFATEINKLIIATGKIGMQAMDIKNPIMMVKDIPDIKMGEIPTKMAKYQELIIPAVDFKAKKLVFTKIRDLGGEDEIGAEFKLTEVPSNNPIVPLALYKHYKTEKIDEQPKFLKIKATDIIKGTISFEIAGSALPKSDKNKLHLIINGKSLIFALDYHNKPKVEKNDTEFYFSYKPLKQETLNGKADIVGRIFLSGYFGAETNISILSESGVTDDDVFFGYMPNTLEVENIEPFKIPEPYTNIATKIDGTAKEHIVKISKQIDQLKDGITFGGVFSYKETNRYFKILTLGGAKSIDTSIIFQKNADNDIMEICCGKTHIPLESIKIPNINKGFYAQLSINLKSKTITAQIDEQIETIKVTDNMFESHNSIIYGDYGNTKNTNFITNMWYWLGDTVDIQAN